ncbi:aldehyde dehydrogenase [Corynespora cassiicola Philippines]|uniref:aldehyde dehydrogenase (NAD(+)) n=1 Tax=Corynespora cassiicola Philippines TaxID=1448308 RepID=A0A2T2P8W9_CORCC|nr:aldehyde dehydrogenase [Corynespora cassiicola Philippines]
MNIGEYSMYINGKAVNTDNSLHSINPSTEEKLWPAPVATSKDVDEAVETAKIASKTWGGLTHQTRKDALYAYANAMEKYAAEFTEISMAECGKPRAEAHGEILATCAWLRVTADFEIPEEVVEETDSHKTIVRYVPLGVVGAIVPWNFPISLGAMKIVQAVMAGNAVIVKPSPFAPYALLKMVELAQRFFPPGVVQSLSGDDSLGPLITAHPGIDKISFTGSTGVGKAIYRGCADDMKRLTLELGGNDPAIIFPDVDIETIAPLIVQHAFRNTGQVCRCIKRIYVHEDIYAKFLKAMVKLTEEMTAKQTLGPLQNKMQYERIKTYFADIEKEGWKVAVGGDVAGDPRSGGKGYFLPPTIIDNPPDDSRIVVEEPFGPIVPVLSFRDEDDAIRRANNSKLGLSASVWTRDAKRGSRVAQKMEAGTVWINRHGAAGPTWSLAGHKESGLGAEWGLPGLKSMSNLQVLSFDKTLG